MDWGLFEGGWILLELGVVEAQLGEEEFGMRLRAQRVMKKNAS
jgi:hypothetical protein